MTAHIAGGTFLISGAELTELREHGPVTAVLQVLDEAGHVLETVPYQQPLR